MVSNFSRLFLATALFVGGFAVLSLSFVFAHEGHDHGEEVAELAQADVDVTEDVEEVEVLEGVSTTLQNPYPVDEISQDVFGDFVVGPGKFEFELAPGQSKQMEITISNRMGVAKVFQITTEDMKGGESTSNPVVLMGEEAGPYTMKDFISVPQAEFTLQHGQRVRVPVTVSLPAGTSPGGRYGSLLVSIVTDANEEADNQTPASVIVSRIGTLFFVTTPGDLVREGEFVSFDTIGQKRFFTKGPIGLQLAHENTGSVHFNPYGTVRITNFKGDEVGYYELDPWVIMPQSLRNRQVEWGRELLFGRYTATAEINRGYDNIVDVKEVVFWVLPVKTIAITFVGIFLGIYLLRFIFGRFEFKRKV